MQPRRHRRAIITSGARRSTTMRKQHVACQSRLALASSEWELIRIRRPFVASDHGR